MKKRAVISTIVTIAIAFASSTFVARQMAIHNVNQLNASFDRIDQEMAIENLMVLKGRIVEVKHLAYNPDISESVLLEALESITSSKTATNKYLDDFAFASPSTSSDVGELCEEFISQIDNQISTIKLSAKSE